MWSKVLMFMSIFLWIQNVKSLENGIGRTPAMGWISWTGYSFKNCHAQEDDCINERMITEAADLFVSEGYKDAGYEYIIVDGPWRNYSYNSNEIVANQKKFPKGIKYLVDYVHNKGLKFGIYTQIDHGAELEAATFAKWELDYIKLDSGTGPSDNFAKLLNETGRPMALACSWPYYFKRWGGKINFEHLKDMCNSWRYHDDIRDSYESVRDIIDEFGDLQDDIQPIAGPGHFNNPDMLMIGNSRLTIEQSRTQMAIWAILAAPLMMSHSLKKISPEAKAILLNKQILAVNQDPMGIQGRRVFSDDKNEVWIRKVQPVYNGSYSYAVAISSKHESNPPSEISVNLTKLELKHPNGYLVVDLFHNTTLDFQTDGKNFTAFVMPSGTAFFKFTPKQVEKINENNANMKSLDINPTEAELSTSTENPKQNIVDKTDELKRSNTVAESGIFVSISLVLLGLLIGVGVSYAFFKREQLRNNYDQFDGRLAFWKREQNDNNIAQ